MPSPRNKKRAKQGFTLIEMIVATFLLSVGVIGAMGAFSVATGASNTASKFHQAALLAQTRFSELEMHPETLGGGGDTQGEFSNEGQGFRFVQHIESSDLPNLFQVTMTIQWGDTEKPIERVFVTYLRNDANTQSDSSTDPNLKTNTGTSSTQPPNGGGSNGGSTGP